LRCRIEINPPWILFFDQTYLPVAPPFFELFFTSNSGYCVFVDFEPDEPVDAISCRKAPSGFGSVFVSTPYQIVSYAEIERTVFFAGKKVDVVSHREFRGYGFRARAKRRAPE